MFNPESIRDTVAALLIRPHTLILLSRMSSGRRTVLYTSSNISSSTFFICSLINNQATTPTFSASTLKIKTLDLKSPMGGFRGLLPGRGLGRPLSSTPYETLPLFRSIHKYVLQNNPFAPVLNWKRRIHF